MTNRPFISYGKQSITQADIDAVVEVLNSDFLTQGPKVAEFEKTICSITGASYCVAVSNGTAALHLAVAALEIPREKMGITSPNTFLATSNAMIYNGLQPTFADIDPATYNITAETIEPHIANETRLLVPVHFAGQPCNMADIANLAKQHNLQIIEDAAHAIGSRYADDGMVGNCQHSDMTIFSFHPVKTITTGEGGAITTNSAKLYERLCMLRTHGVTKDTNSLTQNPGPWYYEMQKLGFNYRMTDIQAALGISQLNRLNKFIKRRREMVDRYNAEFTDLDWLKTPYERTGVTSAFHLYVVLIDFQKIEKTRSDVMMELREKGIGTQVHYIPVYCQPYYRENFAGDSVSCPNMEHYYTSCLSLPLFPGMADREIERVIRAVRGLV